MTICAGMSDGNQIGQAGFAGVARIAMLGRFVSQYAEVRRMRRGVLQTRMIEWGFIQVCPQSGRMMLNPELAEHAKSNELCQLAGEKQQNIYKGIKALVKSKHAKLKTPPQSPVDKSRQQQPESVADLRAVVAK